jgi:hypothetical protein
MMRQVLVALLLVVSCQVWAAGGKPVATGDDAATRAADITRDFQLSTDQTACLLFDTADKGKYFLVRIREKHTNVCGGAPEVSPALFFLKIWKRDGYAVTTAYDGERYLPLRVVGKN